MARFCEIGLLVFFLAAYDTMANRTLPSDTIAQNTIAGIDTWMALVDLMGQESKVLPKISNLRSAAVTIIIRFTRGDQTVHLNMLTKKNALTSDVDLIHTGTPEIELVKIYFFIFIPRSFCYAVPLLKSALIIILHSIPEYLCNMID